MTDAMLPDQPKDSDRRAFFRIEDAVRVSVRRIPSAQVDAMVDRLEQGMAGTFTVMSSLAAISAQMAVSMRRIEQRDPDTALYLKALDQKIEVLGRAFLAGDSDLLAEDAVPVNLSAGGMGMDVRDRFAPGDFIEIKMLLFPSFTGVLTYGEVVDCEPLPDEQVSDDYRYHLRVSFSHMREQDRDILIRHIIRRQSNELRDRRERADAD